MNIYRRRHDEDVNYSIMLIVEFQPISLDEGGKMLPILRQKNGEYGYTNLREFDGMYDAALINIQKKKYKMKSKLQEIRNDVGKNINEAYAQMKGCDDV